MTDEIIINEFICNNGKINANKTRLTWLDKHEDIKEYLLKRYPNDDFISFKFNILRIYYKIEELPKCRNCGKKLYNIFGKWCNTKCQLTDSNFIKTRKIDYQLVGEKVSKTKLNWDIDYKNNVYKKIKESSLKHWGINNYNNKEKQKQTCLEKYGVDNVFKSKQIKEKIKNTTFEKYGVKHIMYLPSVASKVANSEIRKQHEYETKKKNHTFNSSSTENETYKLLKQKYSDIISQYKSDVYPFCCDFYIPSLDLYIECNYHWTHGGHPYNENNIDDINKLNKWKEKKTKFYDNAIKTWTIRDVNKRNIAKQNNLNYIEFWNINEVINYENKNTIM